MSVELDPSLLGTLIAVVDQENPELGPEFISGLSPVDRLNLQATGILTEGKPHESVWIEAADGFAEAAVVVEPGSNEILLYHPEDGPLPISPDSVRRLLVDGERFASWVMRALMGLPATRRPLALIPGCVWDLGMPRLGTKTRVRVLLVIRLHDPAVRQKLAAEMSLVPTSQRVIVLTTSNVPPDMHIPRATVIVPFRDVIMRSGDKSGLDLERLGMFLDRGSASAPVSRKPLACAADGSWLRIHGREYQFRRGKKTVIRKLFDAWERGDEWVPVSDLLEDYEPGTRLEDVFKDSRADRKGEWREYIEIHDRRARLIVPPV
jgi:hypothetical protein